MTEDAKFIMERVFDAPRNLVWEAWTRPEYLARWYGPGVETVIHAFDLSPGGVWHNEMRMKERSMFNRIVFQEVRPPEKLVWHNSSTDKNWDEIPPMMPDWPKTMQMCVEFFDLGDQTKMIMTWEPFNANAAELACFAGAVENLGKGWGAGMAVLEQLLAELQAG